MYFGTRCDPVVQTQVELINVYLRGETNVDTNIRPNKYVPNSGIRCILLLEMNDS
jgi:hypothetical protein